MRLLLINENTPKKIEYELEKEGFRTLRMKSSSELTPPLSSHPDMLVFYSGDTLFTAASYCDDALYVFSDVREYFPDKKIVFTSDSFGKEYPLDAIFNVKVIGDLAFTKEDTSSKSVVEFLRKSGKTILPVKQGYPACTVLSFGNSAITSDLGMARAMTRANIDVTLISDGDITLPPYKNGFIGGASFVDFSTVYFFGDIDTHRDAEIIKAAITKAGFKYKSLSDTSLSDLGGAILIC